MSFYFGSFGADLITVVLVLSTTVYLYFKYTYTYWSRRGVPQIKPTIPFGNLLDNILLRKSVGELVQDFYGELKKSGAKYGGIYFLTNPSFVIIDPDLIRTIMATQFQNFHDRATFTNEKVEPLTGHLFAIKGKKWRNLRVKLTPTFTSGKMKMMFQTLLVCGEQLDEAMDLETKQGGPIDIKDIMARFTTDVIGSVAFGLNCNSLKDPNAEFRKFGRSLFTSSFSRNLRRNISFAAPYLLKLLKVKLLEPGIEKFFMDAVKQTVDYREQSKVVRNDFMNLLIKLKNNESIDEVETGHGKSDSGQTLTFNELAAQVFVFFVAGFETSSSTMAFCLYELCLNSEIQEKLREEVMETLNKNNGKFTYDSIMEMRYMDKVVKETLRKYPIVPLLNRECTQDFQIPDSDVVLKKGTNIFISALGLHRDADYYPDPMKFDPERFNDIEKSSRHQYAYLPFGEGPRNCIGMRFGLMQTKLGLAILMKNYKFTLHKRTENPLPMEPKLVIMSAKRGIWLNSEKIHT